MTVTTEQHGRVLIARIEREAKRNAIDAAVTAGIDAALNRLEDDPGLWAGVLTGTDRIFSAGTDLRVGAGPPTPRGGEYGMVRRHRAKPLVAAVEGVAFGGGFELALACDLIVASRTARFALPETGRGVVATSGALFRAMRALPIHVAKQLLISGDELDADRGYQLGLIARVSEPGRALADALTLAEQICRSAPSAVRATLSAINRQFAEADDRGWAATAAATSAILDTDDRAEGIAAFFERREPIWTGQ